VRGGRDDRSVSRRGRSWTQYAARILQLDLFGEMSLPADQQIVFYQYKVGRANRLVLGDSLLVEEDHGEQGTNDLCFLEWL